MFRSLTPMGSHVKRHKLVVNYIRENIHVSLVNFIDIIVLTISFSVFLSCPSRSQSNDNYLHALPAEKIYLQLDSKVYTNDQTVWFKSIVAQAIDHTPTTISGVLYVELIDPDEKVVERKLIKIAHGIGSGFFDLYPDYPEGIYLIRAFTEWDKNFGNEFFFKEYIHVFDAQEEKSAEPIRNVILINEVNKKRRLKASLDPFAIDSLHKKGLTLFIALDDKKDTISVKKNKDNKYLIDYAVPDECRFVTLQIKTRNCISRSKTIVLNENALDVQFFPESGELVHGLPGRVGFKALDFSGKGKSVEGKIVDGRGEFISFFKSNQLGMGSFIMPDVNSSVDYFARLTSQSEMPVILYPLPKVALIGNTLSVVKKGDKIQLKCSSNYLKNETIYLRASCRGQMYYDIKVRLKEGVVVLSLPASKLPEGIIAFTMLDGSMQPVAERLYFNERLETRIDIALSTDKDTYEQRELTKLSIETTDRDGKPEKANLSILVLNREQMGQMQRTRQNILSYFLLSSDLRGDIENPGFYFSKDKNKHNHLDVLLLTQGWRKYNYTKPLDEIIFRPEAKLSVSGYVSGAVFKGKKKETELTIMTFGQNRSVQAISTDSLGRFNFGVDDEYGRNLNILIQSANKQGNKKNYAIVINEKKSPAISFDHTKSIERADSVSQVLVKKNIERKMVEDAYRLSTGTIYLDEVVVEGYIMTPERKKVMEKYGKPDRVISGKDIQAKEKKWSYGLYSVLLFNYSKDVIIKSNFNGDMYAEVIGGSRPTLVVIDGMPVVQYNYGRIGIIPPSEVSSFEIIKNAKNFRDLYIQAYPGSTRIEAPLLGSVIAIYTRSGKGLFGAIKPIGIVQTNIPVFSTPREFYTPGYQKLSPDDWAKPDLRALLYWAPDVAVDSLGKASAEFYNADNTGEMEIVIEAISETGKIGYQELFYSVKKRR